MSFQAFVSVISIVASAPNTDVQVTSRPQGDPPPSAPGLRASLASCLSSLSPSTSCALAPYSPRSEVLTALGRKAPGPLQGVIIQASGSNEIIPSNEAVTSALP